MSGRACIIAVLFCQSVRANHLIYLPAGRNSPCNPFAIYIKCNSCSGAVYHRSRDVCLKRILLKLMDDWLSLLKTAGYIAIQCFFLAAAQLLVPYKHNLRQPLDYLRQNLYQNPSRGLMDN